MSEAPTTQLTDTPICTACGTQYFAAQSHCRVCDDPRQFVPPAGQTFTTLSALRQTHHNVFHPDPHHAHLTSIVTEPKFAIGQRAILVTTPTGDTILWDLIALLDAPTIDAINAKGNLVAIVISHPHYYTTYTAWLHHFPNATLYIADDDRNWLNAPSPSLRIDVASRIQHIHGPVGGTTHAPIRPGIHVIKAGGHFPGSLLLHVALPNSPKTLLLADTIVTVPSAYTPHPRPPDQTSYAFLWSIPNMIPLAAADVAAMWRAVRGWEWEVTMGAFMGMDVRGCGGSGVEERCKEMRDRMRLSMATVLAAAGGQGVLEE